MKKSVLILFVLVTLLSLNSFADNKGNRISDLDYIKSNYYKGYSFSFKNINIGEKNIGSVMSMSAGEITNSDVYLLQVTTPGVYSINVTPLNKKYYTSLVIGDLMFVSDVSGSKKYYSASMENDIILEDFNGYGNCFRSVYLDKGTYYFKVSGYQYSSTTQVTNNLETVDYEILVNHSNYISSLNIDSDDLNPYYLGNVEAFYGNLSMELFYSDSLKRFYCDRYDRIVIPGDLGEDYDILIENLNDPILNTFKKEVVYSRNNSDKMNLELRSISDKFKKDSYLYVNAQGENSLKLFPGEKVIVKKAGNINNRIIELKSNYPTEYKIELINQEDYLVLDNKESYKVGEFQMIQGDNYSGEIRRSLEGLILFGGNFTNSKIVNGVRDGNMVLTSDKYDLNNKIIYGKYTVKGENYGHYPGFGIENVLGGGNISTHHSWNESVVVKDSTVLYQTIIISNGRYELKISTGNYYNMDNSNIIYQDYGELSDLSKENIKDKQRVQFYFGDNYGGSNNQMIIHDFKIEPLQ